MLKSQQSPASGQRSELLDIPVEDRYKKCVSSILVVI